MSGVRRGQALMDIIYYYFDIGYRIGYPDIYMYIYEEYANIHIPIRGGVILSPCVTNISPCRSIKVGSFSLVFCIVHVAILASGKAVRGASGRGWAAGTVRAAVAVVGLGLSAGPGEVWPWGGGGGEGN